MPDVNQVKNDIKNEINKIPPTTDRNLLAAISYVWIISLIMIVIKRNDDFVMGHARQGLILNILTIVWFIPILGWIIFALAVAGMVLGFINAWQGKEFRAPIVHGWAMWLKAKGV